MKSFLKSLLLENWQRKLISIVLAVIIWIMVNQSLTITKTFNNVAVRVINIPPEKTISGLQRNGTLSRNVTLTLVGNKAKLDDLNSHDLEVVLDASGQKGEWIATITKHNLSSLNSEFDIAKDVSKVLPTNLIIHFTKLVSEKIPIFITQPIGQAPRDYQYLDVWPYQLTLNVNGPEEVVKHLKTKGVRLSFDLSDISKAQLDSLQGHGGGDEVSFLVPDQWKRVSIPLLSTAPIEIDDPKAKDLRIDFVRVSLIPIHAKLPISLFFPAEVLKTYNPKKVTVAPSKLIEESNGLNFFIQPLYAKGVSQFFVRVVEEMMQLTIVVNPTQESRLLNWSTQFINSRLLEDRYVSRMMPDDSDEEVRDLQPLLREEYLRNRFRSYMTHFQLFKADDIRLELLIKLENDKVAIEENTSSPPYHPIFKSYDSNRASQK